MFVILHAFVVLKFAYFSSHLCAQHPKDFVTFIKGCSAAFTEASGLGEAIGPCLDVSDTAVETEAMVTVSQLVEAWLELLAH